MSILTTVEAKSVKGRLFQAGVTLALIIGGVTMVYPFVLMFSGALRSDMDVADMTAVPEYFRDEPTLIRKFLEAKYNYNVTQMNRMRQSQGYDFALLDVPHPPSQTRVDDLYRFVQEENIPNHWWVLGGTQIHRGTTTPVLRELQSRIQARYDGSLADLAVDLGAPIRQWRLVSVMIPDWTNVRYGYPESPMYDEYFKLMLDMPLAHRAFTTPTGAFLENMIYPKYGQITVDRFNEAMKTPIVSYDRFTLPPTVPDETNPEMRTEWIDFIEDILNPSFIQIPETTNDAYQAFLRERYRGELSALNARWHSSYAGFEDISLPGDRKWVPTERRQDYRSFIETFPPEALRIIGPEYAWQDWLRETYGSIETLNEAYGTDYADWSESRIPIDHVESAYVLAHTRSIRRDLALNDFTNVIVAVLLEGRPFFNTAVFVTLSLLFSLTIMPLAAYALSRFSPPGTWRFIMVFMATMSFPPMVGMIPQFLILRGMGLINTFAALVLPVIVNGYLIFLLKGFFDSLPQHLYEAAMIDGASELRMFWEITMSLSKPILAVAALRTFNRAWNSFMQPLLVAPDESMHVLAVWLYQFQQTAGTSTVFASILITSIPTLLIFVFAQRIIMRGIAVPAEK